MPIDAKIFAPSSRQDWLNQRRSVIGASEMPSLFGEPDDHDVPSWASLFRLFSVKTGKTKDVEENESMRRGRLLEPVAIQIIREEHPDWIVQYNTLPNLQYFIDDDNRIGATPDAFVKIPGRSGRGIIQVKSVERSVFRKRWLQDGAVVPPIYVAIQASIECEITESQYAFIAPIVVSHGIELPLQEISLTPGLYAAAAARSRAFWEKVDRGEPYEPDYNKDGDLIREIYAEAAPGKEIDISGDNEVMELAENDRVLSGIEKETLAARKEVKARMLVKMGDAEIARFNGSVIATARTVHKKGYEVKPTCFRSIKFKGSE